MRAVARLMSISERLASRALEVMPGPHSNLPGYELLRPISIERGEGAHLWDADGNEYLDYMCGLGAGTLDYGNRPVLGRDPPQIDGVPYLSELCDRMASALLRQDHPASGLDSTAPRGCWA